MLVIVVTSAVTPSRPTVQHVPEAAGVWRNSTAVQQNNCRSYPRDEYVRSANRPQTKHRHHGQHGRTAGRLFAHPLPRAGAPGAGPPWAARRLVSGQGVGGGCGYVVAIFVTY
ncbi:hypothetical protein EVAR_26677_1 [Eumeta japonica]|uniref:Uncharacterized protein n=1 Tax=Eumeta variegata TaxID=151549 RepID=A0A4C1VPA6_EUMVA|nr:hypothetical protein EVAR_26677_1 [Eumeta japonica]